MGKRKRLGSVAGEARSRSLLFRMHVGGTVRWETKADLGVDPKGSNFKWIQSDGLGRAVSHWISGLWA